MYTGAVFNGAVLRVRISMDTIDGTPASLVYARIHPERVHAYASDVFVPGSACVHSYLSVCPFVFNLSRLFVVSVLHCVIFPLLLLLLLLLVLLLLCLFVCLSLYVCFAACQLFLPFSDCLQVNLSVLQLLLTHKHSTFMLLYVRLFVIPFSCCSLSL